VKDVPGFSTRNGMPPFFYSILSLVFLSFTATGSHVLDGALAEREASLEVPSGFPSKVIRVAGILEKW